MTAHSSSFNSQTLMLKLVLFDIFLQKKMKSVFSTQTRPSRAFSLNYLGFSAQFSITNTVKHSQIILIKFALILPSEGQLFQVTPPSSAPFSGLRLGPHSHRLPWHVPGLCPHWPCYRRNDVRQCQNEKWRLALKCKWDFRSQFLNRNEILEA